MMHVKQISDNEIYLLIKYIKSVLCRAAKRLSYIEDARCLKVKVVNAVSPAKHTKLMITLRDRTYSNCVLKQLVKLVERPQEIKFACLN